MEQLKFYATIKNVNNGKHTRLQLRAPNLNGGIWVCNERARQAAFRRIGCETSALANPRVTTSHTFRAIDSNGWHTYTLYSEA